jgi:hypothetical protein
MFSDDCWLVGALDGTVAWEWSFGDEYERAGGLATVANDPSVDLTAILARRMQAEIPRIVAWAAAAGLRVATPEPLGAVLERGHICAEDGFFALLDELGVTVPPATPVDADPPPDAASDQPAGEVVVPPSAAASGSQQRAECHRPATVPLTADAGARPERARPGPLYLELDSYEDLLARGDAVVDCCRRPAPA